MGIFGINRDDKEPDFHITGPDREWVEENFHWLVGAYGYPRKQQILLDDKSFPQTFSGRQVEVENLISDLATLLDLGAAKIDFEFVEDLRDTPSVPYEIHGKPFDADTVIGKNGSKIFIAKTLLKHPERLIFSLIHEFVKIRLHKSQFQFESGGETNLFIYIAGVHMGFGVILYQNLVDRGRASDGFWETKWNYISEMPPEVMAFALATASTLIGQDSPEWKNQLSRELRVLFENALRYIHQSPSTVLVKSELDALDLFWQSTVSASKNEFDSAISSLQKVLFLTSDEQLKATIYNNIGYNQIRNGEVNKSISNFHKALELNPGFGYANDNLGYALIITGSPEEGIKYLERALKSENNDNAYSYRNLGVYCQAKGELKLAEENFQLAFKAMTAPVDLLEYHYAELLLVQGHTDKAMEFLQRAVDKGEPEALRRMKELK